MNTAQKTERRLEGLRVLLVEDSQDIRDAFQVLLGAEGATVTVAPGGREGLDFARRFEFDVILTDLGLPDIPGDVLIREVASASEARPRIVVVTGYGEPYTTRAILAGADAVLTKPVEWTTLLGEIGAGSIHTAAVA